MSLEETLAVDTEMDEEEEGMEVEEGEFIWDGLAGF